MAADDSFAVQDFLEAITSQLDRTQDALSLKAVNRPLTYAIREFSLSLQVFVEMDDEGVVRFRSAGPNEAGASTVSVGFTTITRTMIRENTVDIAETQGPTLNEAGLAPAEQRQLERLGVRNVAQLRRLSSESSESAVAQFADLPVNRLRAALQAGRPAVRAVQPEAPPARLAPDPAVQPVRVPPGTRRLRIDGDNLDGLTTKGNATLDGVGVPIVESGPSHAVVDLGPRDPRGRLDLRLGDGQTLSFQLGDDVEGPNGGPSGGPSGAPLSGAPLSGAVESAANGAVWEPS
ncbi:hypothetical protein ACIA5D_42680 [Actinoplanes sp. NPDC051513]|uniref:hypothetical protein n=1 Tax=Actinoplanes sp. NPDC051513 TaxID=3363908 RepID=UPI00378A4EF8